MYKLGLAAFIGMLFFSGAYFITFWEKLNGKQATIADFAAAPLCLAVQLIIDRRNGLPCDVCEDFSNQWPNGLSKQHVLAMKGTPLKVWKTNELDADEVFSYVLDTYYFKNGVLIKAEDGGHRHPTFFWKNFKTLFPKVFSDQKVD